jgi:phage tail-like protein
VADYYPPRSFYFRVRFSISSDSSDMRFQAVSGLSVEYDMEEFKEGGENRFTHRLPVRPKYSDLVLRRGMAVDSGVIDWMLRAIREREFVPADVNVSLLNEQGAPLRTWTVIHAIPKKLQVSDLNANENALAIETMELSYRYFTVQ